MAKSFHLTIKDRQSILFQGEAISFSSENAKGKFDILADHANFISLIDKMIKITDSTGAYKEIETGKGVVKAGDNNVEVFVGINP